MLVGVTQHQFGDAIIKSTLVLGQCYLDRLYLALDSFAGDVPFACAIDGIA